MEEKDNNINNARHEEINKELQNGDGLDDKNVENDINNRDILNVNEIKIVPEIIYEKNENSPKNKEDFVPKENDGRNAGDVGVILKDNEKLQEKEGTIPASETEQENGMNERGLNILDGECKDKENEMEKEINKGKKEDKNESYVDKNIFFDSLNKNEE